MVSKICESFFGIKTLINFVNLVLKTNIIGFKTAWALEANNLKMAQENNSHSLVLAFYQVQ